MCGIAGYVWRDGQARLELVKSMCDRIRHRGPDDEGFHVEGGCAIGMRRLSIIDLSTGHQPIPNEDRTLWVVFNGEIYNYRPLREDLIARGHRFRTNSDTETLVHLYEQEGPDGLKRVRGMFAFAIWDSRRRRLYLARDRFGKKPLYYAVLPDGLYFGSELECLREAGVPLEVDRDALRLYFQFNYIPDPYTAFRAIRKLPAGGWYLVEVRASHDGKVVATATVEKVGVGEVFVECTEKAEFPGFEFSRQDEIGACLSQRRLPKEKLHVRRIDVMASQRSSLTSVSKLSAQDK